MEYFLLHFTLNIVNNMIIGLIIGFGSFFYGYISGKKDALKDDTIEDASEIKTYMVPDREGHELVSHVNNVITCENYCKWYSLYFISECDEVLLLSDLYDDYYDIEYRDHTWKPSSVVEFALRHNLCIGEISYEAMVRMYAENFDGDPIPDCDLPSHEDYCKVIKPDNGNLSQCGFDYFDEEVSLKEFDGRLYVE
jgi:hypothetical protein